MENEANFAGTVKKQQTTYSSYGSKQKLIFVYCHRVKLYSAANSGRLVQACALYQVAMTITTVECNTSHSHMALVTWFVHQKDGKLSFKADYLNKKAGQDSLDR